MHILAPHMSCICTTPELQQAIADGYKQIYIMTINGTFKHHILRGENRYVRTKVTSIPGYTEPKIEEGLNFLPAGKIPNTIYEQVLAFFKKVMEVKNSDVEAMIHVLYNPERGYHLGVPPQTVSKASASYDWNYIPAGTSIIVDIHSHNTMAAFFSGTDDRDDKGNISFSGVFGKLKDREPMTVWRFNYFDQKYAASAEDLFEAPAKPEVETPAEWLDAVKIQTYTPTIYQGGHSNLGNVGRPVGNPPGNQSGRTHDQLGKWRYPTTPNTNPQRPGVAATVSPNVQPTGRTFNDHDLDDNMLHFFGSSELPENYQATRDPRGNVIPTVSGLAENDEEHIFADERLPFNLDSVDDGDIEAMYNSIEGKGTGDRPDPYFGVNHLREDFTHGEGEADPVGKSSGELALMDEASSSTDDGEVDPHYAAIATIHGPDVADAWWDISMQMSTLDGLDELNSELICDMAGLMTDEGQLKVFSELFDRLSPTNKAKIETFGF